MRFVLLGFDQDAGVRAYAFKGIEGAADTAYTVQVELALISQYGIRIQDLPLLCRELLERRVEAGDDRTLTFTESDMRVHANGCEMARQSAAQKRKNKREDLTRAHWGAQLPK
ncbi:MAG: hypothetical protein ACE15B_20625 [Bryobacteraceae bacterium]